jgi:hypothetical protein
MKLRTMLLTTLLAASLAWGAQATEKVKDVGSDDDANPASPITISAPAESGRWTVPVYFENPSLPDGWAPYDVTKRGQPGWISMRGVLGDQFGDFTVDANGFSLDADGRNSSPLYLAIRTKDMCLSPELDIYYGTKTNPWEGSSAGTYAYTGQDNRSLGDIKYVRLGELGGKNDKVWRTAVYQVAPGTLKAEGGRFRFSIGYPAPWGRSTVYGEIRVDWIKLADQPITAEPDVPGFWPKVEGESTFKDLPRTGFLVEGKPFFPIILYVNDAVTSAREDSYDLWKRAGFNVLGYYENAVEANRGSRSYWGSQPARVDGNRRLIGLKEFMDEAHEHDLKVAIMLWNSLRQHWVTSIRDAEWSRDPLGQGDFRPYDGSTLGVAGAIAKVVNAYKDHPAYFGINIKDEIDHTSPDWGTPVESVRYLYALLRRVDPNHPQWTNLMGYRRLQWLASKVSDDPIEGFDRYPDGDKTPFSSVAEWMKETERQAGPCVVIPIHSIMDLPAIDPKVRVVTWMSLIHGAQGLGYFVYQKDSTEAREWWEDLKTMLDWVNAVAPRALHRSTSRGLGETWATTQGTRDYYHIEHTAEGDGTTANPKIDACFRQNLQTADRYLIAQNAYKEATQATFTVAGLPAGAGVEVLFENRTITSAASSFTDAFTPYQHHVYRLKAK